MMENQHQDNFEQMNQRAKNNKYEQTSQKSNWKKRFANQLGFVLLRLPSLILADLLMSNSDYLFDEIKRRLEFNSNYFILYMISKTLIGFGLFVCLLLFSLSFSYALRIYKIISLVSLPFLFTYTMDWLKSFDEPVFWYKSLVHIVVCLLTMYLYIDIYLNLIVDKHGIYEKYNINRNVNIEAVSEYLERITAEEYYDIINDNTQLFDQPDESRSNNDQQENNNVHVERSTREMDQIRNKYSLDMFIRRCYIIIYCWLALMLNETSYLVVKDPNEPPFNIISLGYLTMFTYDLTVNLDQLLLRFLIKVRIMRRLITQWGLQNLISFNWFERLKVPHLLRMYFLFKCVYFTINFVLNYDYYYELNESFRTMNSSDKFSIYSILSSFFNTTSSSLTNKSSESHDPSTVFGSSTNSLSDQLEYYLDLLDTTAENHDFNDAQWQLNQIGDFVVIYLKMLLIKLTENFVSIASITSVLSYKFYYIGFYLNKLINGSRSNGTVTNAERQAEPRVENENDMNNCGDVAAILFFLLSIQSGISSLKGNQRVEKFLKNYSLLFIAILHHFHSNLDSQLMTLSTQSVNQRHAPNKSKQSRLLIVCLSLILLPSIILYVLWNNFKLSTWLFAASAFNIELIVKMTVSLLLYTLFVIDSTRIKCAYNNLFSSNRTTQTNESQSTSTQTPHELEEEEELSTDHLDDYIYYVKAFGHVIEFLIAIFLFFNGAYILFFESYGAIRAIMMCIHAYFHIWCQAKKGWSVFIKRRTAIIKLKSLTTFNRSNYRKNRLQKQQQKQDNQTTIQDENLIDAEYEEKMHDACAICFSELRTNESCITKCNHLFHFVCLRKWLYLQDTCPMCQQIVY